MRESQPSRTWRRRETDLAFNGYKCNVCGGNSLVPHGVCTNCGINLSGKITLMTGVMAVPFFGDQALVLKAQPTENAQKLEAVLVPDVNGRLARNAFGLAGNGDHEFVGGGVNSDESMREAMRREILEEISALVNCIFFPSQENHELIKAEFERVFACLSISDSEELPNFFVAQWLLSNGGIRTLRGVFRIVLFKWVLSADQFNFLSQYGLVFSLKKLVEEGKLRMRPYMKALVDSNYPLTIHMQPQEQPQEQPSPEQPLKSTKRTN
ncbi:MAG: NUDIX hydrolase [Patescibacteria group bacterium]